MTSRIRQPERSLASRGGTGRAGVRSNPAVARRQQVAGRGGRARGGSRPLRRCNPFARAALRGEGAPSGILTALGPLIDSNSRKYSGIQGVQRFARLASVPPAGSHMAGCRGRRMCRAGLESAETRADTPACRLELLRSRRVDARETHLSETRIPAPRWHGDVRHTPCSTPSAGSRVGEEKGR